MDTQLTEILDGIEKEFKNNIQKGARHYLEINIGKRAGRLGYQDLKDRYRYTPVIVALKKPKQGMKVRIDGRTFVNYAEFASGIAVPVHLARKMGKNYAPFSPKDSMICNFA